MHLYPKKGHLEFSGAFFLAEIFEKLSSDPYNFQITILLANRWKFLVDKKMPVSTVYLLKYGQQCYV